MEGLKKKALQSFELNNRKFHYYSLQALEAEGYDIKHLPYSIKVLLESILRQCDGYVITEEHVLGLADWVRSKDYAAEVPFMPARVILQDFTGVPAILDLAAMRNAVAELGTDQDWQQAENHSNRIDALIQSINPEVFVDLVIDHSVQVDCYGSNDALRENMRQEFERNMERYQFLNWARAAFRNFSVVPPATGIVHQVNLEYLAQLVMEKKEKDKIIVYPDTLVGTDSHTTMINGLGVLGWGVGGIEAEAGMLGQPSYLTVPEVIGVKLTGELPVGTTATDLALRVTNLLRQKGVVGKFVEFYGDGVTKLSLADRATVANMAPEYGATCGFFPVDEETLNYLKLTGRKQEHIELIRKYLELNGLFLNKDQEEPQYSEIIELDLSTIEAALSGPKRPQDLIPFGQMKQAFIDTITAPQGNQGHGLSEEEFRKETTVKLADGRESRMGTGAVVIAAITSCTNTSNPSVMLGAGLLARNARMKGLRVPAHVKTSLAPGSKVVTDYLEEAGLQRYLDELGFQTVGYGCATCIGNSGPLLPEITEAIQNNDLLVASVLSGNRNFEGRIHSQVKANYLASPPMVVAYALAGTVNIDMEKEPIGYNNEGQAVYFKDIWPSSQEIEEVLRQFVRPELFQKEYAQVYDNNEMWNQIKVEGKKLYDFDETSTYIRKPPFFEGLSKEVKAIKELTGLRVLAKFGDSITTDHISPAGAIGKNTPAGKYLMERGVEPKNFNTYGSRRGNHEVMMRGTFANIRIRNQLAPGTEGGYTRYFPTGELMTIFDASMKYQEQKVGLIVLADKDYGMGSSRDWAAKGPSLLGVKAVIAQSYERIHRSNLVMMGILPLQFMEGDSSDTLGLTGEESFYIKMDNQVKPRDVLEVRATRDDGSELSFQVRVRFDSKVEIDYYRHGGILQMVLRNKSKKDKH